MPTKPEPIYELTPQQKKFVEEYVKDLDSQRASIAAGYKSSKEGKKLLEKKHVLLEINRKLKGDDVFVGPTVPRILKELMCIAFVDPIDLFNPDGTPKHLNEIPEAARRCIAHISVTVKQGVPQIRFALHDKQKALENLGRHLAMFTDQLKMDIPQELGNLTDEQLDAAIRQLAHAAEDFASTTRGTETKH